jgi:hypothetical protein
MDTADAPWRQRQRTAGNCNVSCDQIAIERRDAGDGRLREKMISTGSAARRPDS